MKTFTVAFRIFKEGRTIGWVNILKINGEPFDVEAKINFYKYLGYKVDTNI